MSRTLTATENTMITNKDIKGVFTFKINSVDLSSYFISWNISFSKEFGSASGTFELENNSALFSPGGASEIEIGDDVELFEQYEGGTEDKKFYGVVEQITLSKDANRKTISLICLDYIAKLKNYDVDLEVEGTKVEVTNETLTPSYLPAPNDSLAQVFDFANNSIATDPAPIFYIQDVNNLNEDPQYDGFEVYYDNGQVKLGSPINAKYNYNLICRKYEYYTKGKYAEDILEEILTLDDGYGGYLFGEASAQDVIDNHLTTTFSAEEGGSTIDILTPNLTESTITIETTLSSVVTAGDTSISVVSTSGFPTSGNGEINGDIFTWTGKTGTTLTGIPASGNSALKAHSSGDYVEYEDTYDVGQVWYLSHTNIQTALVSGNFTIGGGGTFDYFDARFGRIILSSAISIASTVTCDINYTFKTLGATGIELNKIIFKPRELDNRFEAINKLRKYLAPNWNVRTKGDDKIWSTYLTQKTTADYTLDLIKNVDYMDDEDLYTRVVMYGKNKNPTNLCFNEGVGFYSTGESYKGTASQVTLSYDRDEGNHYVYNSLVSGAGYIDLEFITPIVYINGVAIDNSVHQIVAEPVTIEVKTTTEAKSGCHGISSESYTKIHTYYYYKIKFAHPSIEPSQSIYLYDANGVNVLTISANDGNMDYGRGIYTVPGDNQNSVIESISTATFYVIYSIGNLIIDYDTVEFKIDKNLIPSVSETLIQATFEYWTVMIPIHDIASVIDGRWDTQVQVEMFSEPPSDYPLTILDLGAVYSIQAIDTVAGFYKPDEIRKFDIDMRFTLQYSIDGVNYLNISDSTRNVALAGGQSSSFDEEDLGTDFQARYLKLNLDYVKRIDYRDGIWVAAFSEISVYNDIILKSEATLISTTTLDGALSGGEATVDVVSTSGFDSSGTAYINGTDEFTYTGITSTSFTSCSDVGANADNSRVSQTAEDDTSLYDDDGLLPSLGDRLYKDIRISDETLYTQTELDDLSKDYLKEFYKDHNKFSSDILFAPYLSVGNTVSITDSYNNLIDINYFIESIVDSNGRYTLTLGRYPA